MKFLIYILGTFFYSGKFPIASGSAGSLVSLAVLIAGANLLAPDIFSVVLCCAILLFGAAGIPISTYIKNREGADDPGIIVIDEAVGQWTAFLFIPSSLIAAHPWIPAAGFLLFRFFDIAKVYPANRAEKLKDGTGIMLDDIIAGMYSCVVLNCIVKFICNY